MRVNPFSQWGGPCRHCGKRFAVRGSLCRRDRRRLQEARDAIAGRRSYVPYALGLVPLILTVVAYRLFS